MRVLLPTLLLISFVLLGCNNNGSSPTPVGPSAATISSFTPASVHRGDNNVTGKITGTNFTGVTNVTMGDGISVNSFNVDSATQITAKFSVSKNATGGARVISVTTAAGTATSSSALLTVERSDPVAVITSASTGNTAEAVHFDGSKSYNPDGGRIVDFLWDFADGSKKVKGQAVDHKFVKSGNFTVGLTVTDNHGGTAVGTKNLKIDKQSSSGVPCTRIARKAPVKFGTIISVDNVKHQVVMRIAGATCGNAFYKYGDLKDGYFDHKTERFYGAVCAMWDLGNGTVRIQAGPHAKYWPPPVPDTGAWIHYQDASQRGYYCPGF